MRRQQRLLISVRGFKEALEAAKGGAHIADVEYPASALGTPYPLNIAPVRTRLSKTGYKKVLVSTNIGERQYDRSSACQAALGVATAGADIIKFGLAELPLEAAVYQGDTIVRTVRKWYPNKGLYPAVFVDKDMRRFFDPFEDGPRLAGRIGSKGLLIDTYSKSAGKGLLDYCSIGDIANFVTAMHKIRKEAWVAGSIVLSELPGFWATGVDVICVRGAACVPGSGTARFGEVKWEIVRELANTIPKRK